MRVAFYFQPVPDLLLAARHYLDLDWDEAWREGGHTIAFQMPGVETQLMLDDAGGWGAAGPMYLVDDLDVWIDAHTGLDIGTPREIPGGHVAQVNAPGHVYYVFSMRD